MQTIQVKVSDTDFQRYKLDGGEMKFTDLVEKITVEYARKSLLECNEIAEQVGLSKMSLDEINAEIKAVRDAKLILDTNVIVSALISNSIPTQILYELVLTKAVDTCLSEEIFAEYIEVLARDKFDKFPNFKSKADVVLSKLQEIGRYYRPGRKIEILSDLSDNKFLEVAAASAADYLITGNKLDFTIIEFEYTRIVSPREYWDNHKP